MRRLVFFVAMTLIVALMSTAMAFAVETRHTQVSFTDTANGYLSGFYYLEPSGQPQGYVSRTADGGSTWSGVVADDQAIYGLGVVDASTAWAVTKTDLAYKFGLKTTNYGANWTPVASKLMPLTPTTPEPSDIAALSASTAVIVGMRHNDAENDAKNGDPAGIWRTADGGANWTSVYRGPIYLPADDEAETPKTLAKFLAVDRAGSHLFALLREDVLGGAAVKRHLVMKSSDAGLTWTPSADLVVTQNNLGNLSLSDISAVAANVAWVAGPAPATNASQIYRTLDGSTWSKTSAAPPFGVNGIDAFDANRAVAVGDAGKVALTVNGGASWTTWTFTGSNNNSLQSVSFKGADPNAAVAVGDDQLIVLLSFNTSGATPSATGLVKRSVNGSLSGSTPAITQPTSIALSVPGTSAYKSAKITGTLVSSGGALSGQPVKIQKSTDNANWTDLAWAYTNAAGAFSYTAAPTSKTYYRAAFGAIAGYAASTSGSAAVIPRVSLGTPVAPKTMKKSKYYTVYGSLKPRHTSGTKPVRIYKYKKVNGKWKSYGYVKAKAYNYSSYSRYKVKMRLTSKGSWRLRAYAPADSKHAATWTSKYDYVTVK